MADTKPPTKQAAPPPIATAPVADDGPTKRWTAPADEVLPTNLNATIPLARMSPFSQTAPLASASPAASASARPVKSPAPPVPIPGVEMMIVEEGQIAGGERKTWRAAEVWTKRRVYGLDSTFKCIEVLDREAGRPEPSHDMIGARLGGGRLRDKDTVRFSYPLPLPGMEAMFMKGKKHGYTSPVERMIVRVRVLVTSADEAAPSWDDIASRWSEPPPR